MAWRRSSGRASRLLLAAASSSPRPAPRTLAGMVAALDVGQQMVDLTAEVRFHSCSCSDATGVNEFHRRCGSGAVVGGRITDFRGKKCIFTRWGLLARVYIATQHHLLAQVAAAGDGRGEQPGLGAAGGLAGGQPRGLQLEVIILGVIEAGG